MGRLRAEGVPFFRLQELIRVAISLADSEEYERVGKCVISVCKKAQKDSADDHTVYLSWQENILCIATFYIFFHLYCFRSIDLLCLIHHMPFFIEITKAV